MEIFSSVALSNTHITQHELGVLQVNSISLFVFFALEYWDLMNPSEKYDKIPEIWQGHNIADYIDPDIMKVSLTLLILCFEAHMNCCIHVVTPSIQNFLYRATKFAFTEKRHTCH